MIKTRDARIQIVCDQLKESLKTLDNIPAVEITVFDQTTRKEVFKRLSLILDDSDEQSNNESESESHVPRTNIQSRKISSQKRKRTSNQIKKKSRIKIQAPVLDHVVISDYSLHSMSIEPEISNFVNDTQSINSSIEPEISQFVNDTQSINSSITDPPPHTDIIQESIIAESESDSDLDQRLENKTIQSEFEINLIEELNKARARIHPNDHSKISTQLIYNMAEESVHAINCMNDGDASLNQLSLNRIAMKIDQIVSKSQACKMIAYYFRGLLAQALKVHCKRVGLSFRNSARDQLGILSPTDQCALLQFVSCINQYYPNHQNHSIDSLLSIPLLHVDISWRKWRYLLGGQGRSVLDRAMTAHFNALILYA